MRLEPSEKQAIIATVTSVDPTAEIWLFGSRVDETLKGGDIDLLVLSSKVDLTKKLEILAELKIKIGDQRIDLVVKDPRLSKKDEFIQSIIKRAIRL